MRVKYYHGKEIYAVQALSVENLLGDKVNVVLPNSDCITLHRTSIISIDSDRVLDVKPCPFCGGRAELIRYDNGSCAVVCIQCKSAGPEGYDEKYPIKKWNERKNF